MTMVCGSFQMANTGLTAKFENGLRRGVVDGINVIEIDVSYSNYDGFLARVKKFVLFAMRASKLALTQKYDIIFATSTPLTTALPGLLAKYFRRKRFIFEVRDLWPELPKAMGVIKNKTILYLLSLFETIAYRSADQCIGLSPGIVDGIKSKLSIKSRDKVYFLPNGCDIDFFSEVEVDDAQLPVENDDFIAIFAGAHGRANGLDVAVRAAKFLQDRDISKIKLVFIGNGAMKPSLVRSAQGLNNCVFLDPLPKHELKTLLKRADVGLMLLANFPAFYYGTSPNKFFDYIACGLPVLTNYPGWIADLIQKNDAGIVASPDSAEKLAESLIELSNKSYKDLAMLSANSLKLASVFSRKRIANNFVELIDSNFIECLDGDSYYA